MSLGTRTSTAVRSDVQTDMLSSFSVTSAPSVVNQRFCGKKLIFRRETCQEWL